jgi:endonuclease YncB( thermonuclease family)
VHCEQYPRISAHTTVRHGFLRHFMAAALALSFCATQAPARQTEPMGSLDGVVTSVGSGDRLTFSNSGKEISVRLYGIAAPVITKISRSEPWLSKPGQRFAGRAFMALAKKVLHKQTRIEIIHLDRHDRAVAVIYADGRDINLEMISEGWGWVARHRSHHPIPAEYIRAEEQARSCKAGLWQEENPIPPWEFKKTRGVQNVESW